MGRLAMGVGGHPEFPNVNFDPGVSGRGGRGRRHDEAEPRTAQAGDEGAGQAATQMDAAAAQALVEA